MFCPYSWNWKKTRIKIGDKKTALVLIVRILFPARLSPQFQTLDDILVTPFINSRQIIKELAPGAYHFDQSVAGIVVMFVDLQVFGELIDAIRQQCNLNAW
jgi:hypothetical protein